MKRSLIVLGAAALAVAGLSVVRESSGAPRSDVDKPGSVDDSVPPSCATASSWRKVYCPQGQWQTVASSPTWSSTGVKNESGSALTRIVAVDGKTLTCKYDDYLYLKQTSPTACVTSTKFNGFNCCN